MLPQSADLLAWYNRNRRTLPWRALPGVLPDPYHVWLSEIMLQQTTVTATIPYYQRFLARFPTIHALAAAEQDDVMQAWAGLGYYARARNLHACAKAVAALGGDFPAEVTTLQTLPGIGPYTARAIAAIAFAIPVVPIDGNVERVIARLFAITQPLPAAKPAIAAALQTIASQQAAIANPSDFAQSLFDLGASLCGRTPDCAPCPWASACLARAQNIAATLPRKAVKPARPIRHGAAFWLQNHNAEILLRRRPAKGLLGGMMELPGTDWHTTPLSIQAALALAPMPAHASTPWRHAGQITHVFTHFELRLHLFATTAPPASNIPGTWHKISTLAEQALPSLMRKCTHLAQSTAKGLAL